MLKGIRILDEFPPSVRARRGLDKDTQKMIDMIKANKGKVVAFEFEDMKICRKAYFRLRDAKRKSVVTFKKMSRKENTLYVLS